PLGYGMNKRALIQGVTALVGATAIAGAGTLITRRQPPAPPPLPGPAVASSPAAGQLGASPAAAANAELHPGDAALALQAGALAGDSGQYRTALRWFRRAAATDPKLLPAIAGQGQM